MSGGLRQKDEAFLRVRDAVDAARRGWRVTACARGLLRTLALLAGGLLTAVLLDNLFHLPAGVRLVLVLSFGAGLVALVARLVAYPLLRPLTDEMVAAHVERAGPELENRLINAVLLRRRNFRDSLVRDMADAQVSETAEWMSGRKLPGEREIRELWRPLRWVLAVGAVLALYGLLFTAHFGNALHRFIRPTAGVPPITDTRLQVVPGDVQVLQGEPLRVEARVRGVLPESALIETETAEGPPARHPMDFEGDAFIHRFSNVQADFDYRIRAGDARTKWYSVTARRRPAVASVRVTCLYPEYTGLPDEVLAGTSGDIRVPAGSRVRLEVETEGGARSAHVELQVGGEMEEVKRTVEMARTGEGEFRCEWKLERSGNYAVHLVDDSGVTNMPGLRRMEAVPDSAPRVTFLKPGRDVSVKPDARVVLLAAVEDDFSLREVHLFIQPQAGRDWVKERSRSCEPGTREAREGAVIDLREIGAEVGDSISYYMRANDGLPRPGEGPGRSRTYHIRVGAPETAEAGSGDGAAALRDVVRELLELQRRNVGATRPMARDGLDADDMEAFRAEAAGVLAAEEAIYERAREAVLRHAGEGTMSEALGRIASGPLSDAVSRLKDLRAASEPEAVPGLVDGAVRAQEKVVRLLRKLLAQPEAALAELEAGAKPKEEPLREEVQQLARGKELAERLLRALEEFAEDQRRVVELSNRLGAIPVDDFTEEDEKKLDEIIYTEKEWTEFFQEAATDLSKLQPQDFSLPTQAEEFLEVYSEIQQAVEAAERRAIEMAVPHEQAGLELAEEIETNIEKWLMETKDDQRWSMEEPLEDYETPMTELPDELQDLIGDLIESEEDMEEQFEDITSGWLDSLDRGAGWGTMDGPISNMSAKGVTGNRLPNEQEVGGRSGEGRTGKSTGQFVEKKATGKGGRQTPSRLTPDPFEAGRVEDTSGEAPTGASGGGKVSGAGAEGFRGPVPPPLQEKLQRLASRQRQLIDRARRIDYGLKKYRAPRGRLPETIELMESQADALAEGEVSTFAGYQRVVLSNFREVKELTDKQKQLQRDRSALLPKRLRDEISSARTEDVPERYRRMVRNYFRALSEAATKRR